MRIETITGIAASIFTGVALIPQLVKIWKEKKSEAMAYSTLLIMLAGLVIWVVYGFFMKDLIIIISNIFSLLVNACILILDLWFKKKTANN